MNKNRKKAAALSYKNKYPAPAVVAKGKGHVAAGIIKAAEKHGVPVVKNDNLAEILFTADLYSFIPEEQYEIVAEILSFIRDPLKQR